MPALPGRPDLDQLRRQARELLRAAAASDEQALRRIRVVSPKHTLSPARHRPRVRLCELAEAACRWGASC